MSIIYSIIRKKWRKAFACLVGVCLVLVTFGYYPFRPLIDKMDRALGVFITRYSGGPAENKELVLLGIDEASMSLDGLDPEEIEASPALKLMDERFPWDRRVWAEVIERLANAGVKLIVFDLIFSSASDLEADEALAAAIKRHPKKVMLVSTFSDGGAVEGGGKYTLITPHELFMEGEYPPYMGYVNFQIDPVDNIVRNARYTTTLGLMNEEIRRTGEPEFRSLAAEVIHALGKQPPSGDKELRLQGHEDTGAKELYAPLSVYTIFSEKEWQMTYQNGDFFRDKVVLIGPVAPRFQDSHLTPMGSITGPQLHMQAIACGLDGAFIQRVKSPWPIMLAMGFLALIWSIFVSRPLLSVFGVICITGGTVIIAMILGDSKSLLIPISGGILTSVVGWAVAQSYEIITERLEKNRLRRDFRRFVSRDVADAMIDAQDDWQSTASGVKRRVVVLFSDVRDFTERSEASDPADLVKQLNQYLTKMVEVIFRHGGTLDKFIGDAVMAHWGALGSGDQNRNALQAIMAAKDMIVELDKMNAAWEAEGQTPFLIGIGLHGGEAIAGEIGSPDRTEFGVIGDTVNLASRLEGLTKEFHCQIIFSEDVKTAAQWQERAVDLGSVRVKGRKNGLRLFGVGDEADIHERLKSFERDVEGCIVMKAK